MRSFTSVLLAASLASTAYADAKFTTPAAGATEDAGDTITMVWEESGTAPLLTALAGYSIALMAGGNDDSNMVQLAVLVANGDMDSGVYSATGTLTADLGGDTDYAYFLKMTSAITAGGQVINYSDRFTITGMTGTFTTDVTTGIESVSGTDGPATELTEDDTDTTDTDTTDTTAGYTSVYGATGSFAIPYSLQTGLTRYAPMQGVPPTAITATALTPSPMFPTSAFTIATTYMSEPTIIDTLTEAQTFIVESIQNTAAAASSATGDAKRYLDRWKD